MMRVAFLHALGEVRPALVEPAPRAVVDVRGLLEKVAA